MPRYYILGDIHPGRFGNGEGESRSALEGHARFAASQGSDALWINGDLDETFLLQKEAMDVARYRAQCLLVGQGLQPWCQETGQPVRVVRGNHDRKDLEESHLLQQFDPEGDYGLSFRLADSLVVFPNEGKFVLTHGHLLDRVRAMRELIEQAIAGRADPCSLCCDLSDIEEEYVQNERRRDRRFIHPIMSAARALDRVIRTNITEWIEGSLVPAFMRRAKEREQRDHEENFLNATARHQARVRAGMTDTAAHLAYALGSRLAVVGHDHVWGLVDRHVFDAGDGQPKLVKVANSGDFIGRKRPKAATFVDTDHRTVSIMAYRDGQMEVIAGPEEFAVPDVGAAV